MYLSVSPVKTITVTLISPMKRPYIKWETISVKFSSKSLLFSLSPLIIYITVGEARQKIGQSFRQRNCFCFSVRTCVCSWGLKKIFLSLSFCLSLFELAFVLSFPCSRIYFSFLCYFFFIRSLVHSFFFIFFFYFFVHYTFHFALYSD